jgi:hypothetical protein
MKQYLSSGGVNLAVAAAPMWFFGQAMKQPPCYPREAVDPSGKQTPSAALCAWPNAGCHCRNPGVGIGHAGPSFPVYFSFSKCTDTEVRVAYNLFYEKDGFQTAGINGHAYDWERAIVIWAKGGDGKWAPSQLLMSQHSGYGRKAWKDIQNTFNTEDAKKDRGGDNGRQNLDHPKIYVAWSKHANYDNRNTGWNDVLSQLTNNAFRSQDWWYFPDASDYIQADRSTSIGKTIAGFNWGDASSNPAAVHDGLCQA